MTVIAILSFVMAIAWLPLSIRFNRGWRTRKNPVSLAICAASLLFAYTNVLFGLAILGDTSWRFFGIATHVFDAIVVANFYFSFWWSDNRFVTQRRDYSIPPTNTTSTKRGP